MNSLSEYKDIVAFHPGYYITEVIEDLGISQAEFAKRLGTTGKTLSKLVNGQINLSNEIAKKLAAMLGTSVELWVNLQATYDQKVIEIERERDLDEQIEVVKQLDYSYFVNVAGLPQTKDAREKVSNLCKYFMVSDLRILGEQDFLVNMWPDISTIEARHVINSRAWIQTAINYSGNIKTDPFDSERLKRYLPELRSMTVKEPVDFMPRIQQAFSECGIAFVLLPHLRNSEVSSAVKWVSSDRVVLAMNNRGLDTEKFWVSLFREIKHVLQQKVKTIFVNSSDTKMQSTDEELDTEADKFAMNCLIPPSKLKAFAPNKQTSDEEISSFAESIGIHPGIVAGRLQRDKIISSSRCNKLKDKYIIDFPE
ncbi:MAG: HigA family addiction module antidote protein [Lachnospiraceae bacterium]|nr:HigA family addiction module antidote protein [Candidatus Equihabitans merdae]